ncbi:hypothetical protein L7F22_063121 [Adiantum nelumboides]|nr:hypothetical protein [Adiantum nelumboides]
MEVNKVPKSEIVMRFELFVILEIRDHVRTMRMNNGEDWEAYKLASKDEYFMEDAKSVTKRTFLEWIANPKEGISKTELLREFEHQFSQLSGTKRHTLHKEKDELSF